MSSNSVLLPLDTGQAKLAGCDVIYYPAGQAEEYSSVALNIYRGCGNCCRYCYAPAAVRAKRAAFDAGALPKKDFLKRLRNDAEKCQANGLTEQILLCFTTDPYHPGDTGLTRQTMEILREQDLSFSVLTKGGTRALRDIDLFRPDRDAFASTVTSLDDATSLRWECNAALPADRIASLRAFHDAGIFTWVSLEPTLDAETSLAIVRKTHRFVDLYKIGKLNYAASVTDWQDYTLRMIELCSKLGVKHYIKRDLAQFLPAGYPNPLRVQQHH
jgi:DNA repair photolyase